MMKVLGVSGAVLAASYTLPAITTALFVGVVVALVWSNTALKNSQKALDLIRPKVEEQRATLDGILDGAQELQKHPDG